MLAVVGEVVFAVVVVSVIEVLEEKVEVQGIVGGVDVVITFVKVMK